MEFESGRQKQQKFKQYILLSILKFG